MIAGMEMMACPNLSVPAEVMQHIVNVESGQNPYAIGVVGGQLVRQPQNYGEAVATAQMLESKGYNYSLGIAQVNRNNLAKYGLDSYDKAFSTCGNLAAGSRILAECYNSAGGDWGKAFSCYYSGNFVTGYRTGYVRKVFDSINRAALLADSRVTASPIQLVGDASVNPRTSPLPAAKPVSAAAIAKVQVPAESNGAAYRVAIRSSLIDTALNSLVSPAVAAAAGVEPASAQDAPPAGAVSPELQQQAQALGGNPQNAASTPNGLQQMMQQVQQANYGRAPAQAAAGANGLQQMMQQVQQANYGNQPAQDPYAQRVQATVAGAAGSQQTQAPPGVSPAMQQQLAAIAAAQAAEQQQAASNDIYEPQVRGPNDPIQPAAQAGMAPPQGQAAQPAQDPAKLQQQQGYRDDALVF
ncbi:lytic transglycosylase domain-containing protein [Dyella sp.]|uniref:lytic transglycosylase domain-containing protein n=1 Tax=Dyella sp. TaxID=1869338 RepID=UPI0039C8B90C